MQTADVLAGLAILVGLVGIVVPVLPGTLLIGATVVVWAVVVGGSTAWAATAVALAVLAVGSVVRFTIPGRSLREAGIPRRTLVLGALVGFVGFFVIPVLGLFLGFVLGVYAAELQRLGRQQAGPATWLALRAVVASVLIEAVAAIAATAVWLAGAIAA